MTGRRYADFMQPFQRAFPFPAFWTAMCAKTVETVYGVSSKEQVHPVETG
jgi:hypothetical protein